MEVLSMSSASSLNVETQQKPKKEVSGSKILSDIVIWSRYSRHLENEKRRESYFELCERNMGMHIKKFPLLEKEIRWAYEYVKSRDVFPSGRSFQYAGKPIELSPSRIFNCTYAAVNDPYVFAEAMYILLMGSGLGYSVQEHHIKKLPTIKKPNAARRFLIPDSAQGWAEAVDALMKAYFFGKGLPRFDYSEIRPKGARIKTSGGKAPGPEPLKRCLERVEKILASKEAGQRLSSVECSDIMCHIADSVHAGGIRMAALICLFDFDNEDMRIVKSNFKVVSWKYRYENGPVLPNGDQEKVIQKHILNNKVYFDLEVEVEEPFYGKTLKIVEWVDENTVEMIKGGKIPWFYVQPQRGRANNSAVILRYKIKKNEFLKYWEIIKESGCGEPGIFFTNDKSAGTNPSLRKGTKVLTDKGIFPIEELQDKNFKVKNLYGEWADATCFLSGKGKQLHKLTLENGSEIYCTEEHKWPILEKYGNGTGFKKYETKDLKSGMKLPLNIENQLHTGTLGDYDDGMLVGWLYGDGWMTERENDVMQYGFCCSKEDVENGLLDVLKKLLKDKIGDSVTLSFREDSGMYECNFQRRSAEEYFEKFGVKTKKDGLPKKIWTECSNDFIKGFIDGYFSSDGDISKNGKNTDVIILTSKYEVLIKELQELLGFYGISSRIKKSKIDKMVKFPKHEPKRIISEVFR